MYSVLLLCEPVKSVVQGAIMASENHRNKVYAKGQLRVRLDRIFLAKYKSFKMTTIKTGVFQKDYKDLGYKYEPFSNKQIY